MNPYYTKKINCFIYYSKRLSFEIKVVEATSKVSYNCYYGDKQHQFITINYNTRVFENKKSFNNFLKIAKVCNNKLINKYIEKNARTIRDVFKDKVYYQYTINDYFKLKK